jgi:hypothetical protein
MLVSSSSKIAPEEIRASSMERQEEIRASSMERQEDNSRLNRSQSSLDLGTEVRVDLSASVPVSHYSSILLPSSPSMYGFPSVPFISKPVGNNIWGQSTYHQPHYSLPYPRPPNFFGMYAEPGSMSVATPLSARQMKMNVHLNIPYILPQPLPNYQMAPHMIYPVQRPLLPLYIDYSVPFYPGLSVQLAAIPMVSMPSPERHQQQEIHDWYSKGSMRRAAEIPAQSSSAFPSKKNIQ